MPGSRLGGQGFALPPWLLPGVFRCEQVPLETAGVEPSLDAADTSVRATKGLGAGKDLSRYSLSSQ